MKEDLRLFWLVVRAGLLWVWLLARTRVLARSAKAQAWLVGAWKRASDWPFYTPLRDASIRAYDEMRRAQMPLTLRQGYVSPEEIIEVVALYLAHDIPIYGKHPPAQYRERVSDKAIRRSYIRGGHTLISYSGPSTPILDLAVRHTDLRRSLRTIRNYWQWKDNHGK